MKFCVPITHYVAVMRYAPREQIGHLKGRHISHVRLAVVRDLRERWYRSLCFRVAHSIINVSVKRFPLVKIKVIPVCP
jgi:hypothetical protein